MAPQKMAALRKAALLIRFRTARPNIKSRKYATYKTIASILKLTQNEVQHICRKAFTPKKPLTSKQLVRKLDQEHIDFLINAKTLERWAGLTMKQRTIHFHRQFTNKRIAVTSLRRLYLKHKIRCKKVRQEKVMPQKTRENFTIKSRSLVEDIENAKREGRLIVYIDETLFSKRSIKLREWANKNSNLTVNQEDVYVGFRSVIAGMTEERGIGLIKIHDRACVGEDFRDYLIQLRSKLGKRPVSLFMDNAGIHKKPCVKEWWPKLNMEPIWNVGYSPEFQPIEAVFSKVKREFNSQRLNNLVNKTGFNADKAIEAAFRTITTDHCAACVRKSFFLLQRES